MLTATPGHHQICPSFESTTNPFQNPPSLKGSLTSLHMDDNLPCARAFISSTPVHSPHALVSDCACLTMLILFLDRNAGIAGLIDVSTVTRKPETTFLNPLPSCFWGSRCSLRRVASRIALMSHDTSVFLTSATSPGSPSSCGCFCSQS